MAAPLDPKLAELLVRLLQLDGGNYETFHPYFSAGSEGEAELIGHGDERVPEGPIKELNRLGFIDMQPEPGKRLGTFTITTEGRSLGGQLASAGDGAVDLSWPAVEPILRQIHNVWKQEGAPELGIGGDAIQAQIEPPMETAQLVVILQELTRDEWLDTRSGWGPPLPMACAHRRALSPDLRAGRPKTLGSRESSLLLCWRNELTLSRTPRNDRSYGRRSLPAEPPSKTFPSRSRQRSLLAKSALDFSGLAC